MLSLMDIFTGIIIKQENAIHIQDSLKFINKFCWKKTIQNNLSN